MKELDTIRATFEKWCIRENGKWGKRVIERNADGQYCVLQTYMDWTAWQAGYLAALSTIDLDAIPIIHGRAEIDSHDDAIRRECEDRAVEYCLKYGFTFMHDTFTKGLRAAILGTEPARERDIAGEIWDMLADKLPARGRTELYDEMRKRFPAILGAFIEPAREGS